MGVDIIEPNTPPLVIVKVPPVSFLDGDLVFTRPGSEVHDPAFNPGKGKPACITDHRNNQAALGADCNPDVEVLVVDDIIPVDGGIEDGKGLQCASMTALMKKDMKPSLTHAISESLPCSFFAAP